DAQAKVDRLRAEAVRCRALAASGVPCGNTRVASPTIPPTTAPPTTPRTTAPSTTPTTVPASGVAR
ncbi:MAG TPA: serine/threonine-protein phosphatase, partial [Intrasporangium sp.]|nr:serine/threonine-protein phosphatase [Intrasporangium sp.]